MAPTEETVLSSFLLPAIPLPVLISIHTFTDIFPRSQQSSPLIRSLYRDLQLQRAKVLDKVALNIAAEVKRGNAQRLAVVRAQRASTVAEDDELDLETVLFAGTSNLPLNQSHTLRSIIPDLRVAVDEIEVQIRQLQEEADLLLEEMQSTIGSLSDLRYGRFGNSELPGQVLEGLKRLQNTCETA